MLNYYKILEIPDFSDEKIIKGAYRNLSKKYHPDINKDPAASDYFIMINSAYEFLMDQNKRLLLNQFLQSTEIPNPQKVSNTSAYTNQKTKEVPQPIIHSFYCNNSHFTLNDYLLITWNVSQCKNVRISVFGNVDFVGSEYYKIDQYVDKLTITLHITGLDDKEYISEMILHYQEEDPYKKAFHKILLHYPDVEAKHFKKEELFYAHGRLGKKEFTYRMIVLSALTLFLSVCYLLMNGKLLLFMLLFALICAIYLQLKKRAKDCKEYKQVVKNSMFPIWDLRLIKMMFIQESEPNDNEFGLKPKVLEENFFQWMFSFNGKLSWFNVLKIASSLSFVILMFSLLVKINGKYDEVPIDLKYSYTKSDVNNRVPNYLLIFEGGIEVELIESEFAEIFKNKELLTYKAGINGRNEIQYIKALHIQSNESIVFYFGVLSNANPILIFILLLFIAQLFAMFSLKKQEELIYAKGILIFILLINFFIIIQM